MIKDVYRVDILVEGRLILELKSVEHLAPVHSKQLLTYLRVTGLPVGLIMNFGGALFKDGVRRVNQQSQRLCRCNQGCRLASFRELGLYETHPLFGSSVLRVTSLSG